MIVRTEVVESLVCQRNCNKDDKCINECTTERWQGMAYFLFFMLKSKLLSHISYSKIRLLFILKRQDPKKFVSSIKDRIIENCQIESEMMEIDATL